jgi:septal ring factor EnvC (AmiA/AmiB activator)
MGEQIMIAAMALAAEQNDTVKELRAEIERLRTDKDVVRSQERNTSYEKSIEELEAEIERLRAALKTIRRT